MLDDELVAVQQQGSGAGGGEVGPDAQPPEEGIGQPGEGRSDQMLDERHERQVAQAEQSPERQRVERGAVGGDGGSQGLVEVGVGVDLKQEGGSVGGDHERPEQEPGGEQHEEGGVIEPSRGASRRRLQLG
jgi:hypothetical protein